MSRKQNSLMRFSRTERLAQLSEQEIVIEKKKREIQAKIEAQRKKETEEALRKLEASKETKNNKPGFSKKLSWKRDEYNKEKRKEKLAEEDKKESLKNAFSNDGSFLDQFKKLSKTGLAPNNVDVQTLAMVNKRDERDDKQNYDRGDYYSRHKESCQERENDSLELSEGNTSRKPLDSNVQLQLPPPGVVQLIPQNHLQMVSVVQPAVHNPMIPSSPVQMPTLQPVVMNSVPKFTTNEIQLKAISSPSFKEMPSPVPAAEITNLPATGDSNKTKQQFDENSYSYMFRQPPLTTQLPSIQSPVSPQSIPTPSPMHMKNIPPPPHKETEPMQRSHPETISMTFKNNTVKKLEITSNPLEDDDDDDDDNDDNDDNNVNNEISNASVGKDSRFSKKEKVFTSEKSRCAFPLFPQTTSMQEKDSSRISPALYNQEENERTDGEDSEKNRHLAEVVAQCGDDFEDILRNRNKDDPALGFLFDKNSKEYISFRQHVLKYRQKINDDKDKSAEKQSVASNSSEDEDNSGLNTSFKKKLDDKKQNKEESEDSISATMHFLRNKQEESEKACEKRGDGYQADNEEDAPYYQMPDGNSQEGFMPFRKQAPESSATAYQISDAKSTQEVADKSQSEERRKRKRKSRWGEVVAPTSNLQPPAVVTSLNLQTPGKIPQPKTNLLSQLTRSDPGLLQYARQTFGSTNLSEEDWKKAEDHYKINLLYQDLVKKRAEIDKLERAGKFKYEYDSDEDVEGGTWEHKLRQQEMMATQLWAEELTRQAAGKHHIGDFLPPEELERFMEKYNAVKEGREPDLSDYKEFKLKEDNVGYQLLQKMGWNEGQGLGQDGSGITHPVNKATTRHENQGLGVERPDGLEPGDDEYDAYRKRMMLAYRFRPNPLNNPRRPYY